MGKKELYGDIIDTNNLKKWYIKELETKIACDLNHKTQAFDVEKTLRELKTELDNLKLEISNIKLEINNLKLENGEISKY